MIEGNWQRRRENELMNVAENDTIHGEYLSAQNLAANR